MCDYGKALWPELGVWLGLYKQDTIGQPRDGWFAVKVCRRERNNNLSTLTFRFAYSLALARLE